jgi:stage V sporulation protein R
MPKKTQTPQQQYQQQQQNNRFLHGTPLLLGDSTVPGVQMPDDLRKLLPTIFKEVRDFGCDYYDTVVEMLTYDQISEIAAYGGFPVRFPHWKWGMEYEELQRGYEHGMHRIYEMVINTNPCYIYCLDSNTMVDNVTVVAHALFHCDFFKNNIFFSPTSQNMMNQLANHGTRIRRYMARWGKETVTRFIDWCLRIETLIDPMAAWDKKVVKDVVVTDQRTYRQPPRLRVDPDHDYMEEYINPPEWRKQMREKVDRADAASQIGIFKQPTKDIMRYLRDHAPLKPWQQDIVSMLYEESLYFAPQRMTKTLNEGWASYGDFNIMCRKGFVGLGQNGEDFGIVEYAQHKMGVLGGKYSMNPYKLGYCMFLDIEERWDKGRFGPEWEDEKDIVKKEKWDQKLGLGHEKVFEVRRNYNDLTAINEFFTEEFCNKFEFFEWKQYPNGEIKIESRDHKKIKHKLMQRHVNGGLPDIRLTDPNYRGHGQMLLQHHSDGRGLLDSYTRASLQALSAIWQDEVHLATRNKAGEEIVYTAFGPGEDEIRIRKRDEFEKDD